MNPQVISVLMSLPEGEVYDDADADGIIEALTALGFEDVAVTVVNVDGVVQEGTPFKRPEEG